VSISKILSKVDFVSLVLAICLAALGVVALAGATQGGEKSVLWIRQLDWLIVGLFFLIVTLFIDYRFLIRYAFLLYILGIVGLILCFVPHVGHFARNAYSWIKIGPLPQIQTSEFAKITTIIMLARILSSRQESWNGLLDILRPLVIGAIPSLLVLKQPDLGTAIVFIPVTVVMMFAAGMPFIYLLVFASPLLSLFGMSHDLFWILVWGALLTGLILAVVLTKVPWSVWLPFVLVTIAGYYVVFEHGQQIWDSVADYKKARIVSYWNPDIDPKGATWNINQSKIALGSGGFWGKGMGQGTQSKFDFLPEFQHDFIFSTIGEQKGFLGGAVILGLFILLIIRGLDTAVGSKTLPGALIATGVVSLIFSHVVINVGVVTGLLPVTGLPLTFISSGGSSMVASMIAVGLIVGVRMRGATEMIEDNSFLSGRSQMSLPKTIEDDF